METEVDYDLNKICRSCLTNSGDLVSVFESSQSAEVIALCEIIMTFTQVQITKNDGLPHKICFSCAEEVRSVLLYKQKIEASDLKLRNFVERKFGRCNIKDEIEFGHCKIEPEVQLFDEPQQHRKQQQSYHNLRKLTLASVDVDMNDVDDADQFAAYDDDNAPNDDNSSVSSVDNNDDMHDLDYILEEKDYKKEEDEDIKPKMINGRLQCHLCEKTLADRKTLKHHIRLHTGKNLKKCTICGRGFTKPNHLERHMRCHEKKEYKCEYCEEKFDTVKDRRLHLLTHDEYKTADKKSTTLRNRSKRNKKEIKGNEEKKNDETADLDFDIVDYKSGSDEGYTDVPETVNGRIQCKLCNKSLGDRRTFKLHMRLHTGKNLKRCPECNRGFSKKSHLQRHMKCHLMKVYACDYCDESFDTVHNRRLHLLSHDVGGNGSKGPSQELLDFKLRREVVKLAGTYDAFYCMGSANATKHCLCKVCDQQFDTICKLRTHLMLHMNDDVAALASLNLRERPDLFDMTRINIFTESDEGLAQHIQQKLRCMELTRFYSILNQQQWELSLSDSETDGETERVAKLEPASQYVCAVCGMSFDRAYKIITHMKSEVHQSADFAAFKCVHCFKMFPCQLVLDKHLRSQCENTMKLMHCKVCRMRFMWQDSYDAHMAKMHSRSSAKLYKQVLIRSYTCEICAKSFARSEHLERHRKIHVPGEKKFACDICKKKFNRKDNLKSHMRVHNEVKEVETDKHLCVYCGRSFSNSSNLIVHMRRHTGEKPYKCDLCDKGFPRSSDLQCHRRTHTGEKPCLCTICGKGFSRSNKLVRHMRIHTGVRPYKCTYCDRAFTQSNDLTLHIRRHTGDKPYVCGICGDRFIQGTALATHRRMQGHYEDAQPTPFSSISVNNPNRFTNANRVNRIGTIENTVKTEDKSNERTAESIIITPLLNATSAGATPGMDTADNSMTSPQNSEQHSPQPTMSTSVPRSIPFGGPPYHGNPFALSGLEFPMPPHFNPGQYHH